MSATATMGSRGGGGSREAYVVSPEGSSMTASLAESFVESTRTPFVSARRALWLAVVSAAARARGFLIPVVVGSVFGAGSQTDAYFLAYGSVLLIGGTLGQGIAVSVVPYAARALAGATPAISFFDRKAL